MKLSPVDAGENGAFRWIFSNFSANNWIFSDLFIEGSDAKIQQTAKSARQTTLEDDGQDHILDLTEDAIIFDDSSLLDDTVQLILEPILEHLPVPKFRFQEIDAQGPARRAAPIAARILFVQYQLILLVLGKIPAHRVQQLLPGRPHAAQVLALPFRRTEQRPPQHGEFSL
jgi:hypothetical protein